MTSQLSNDGAASGGGGGGGGCTVGGRTLWDPSLPLLVLVSAMTLNLTAVNLGRATALDAVSGAIQPVAEPKGPYTSGLHVITWTATDQAGNKARATQRLTVLPLADLALDQTVSEGSTVTVGVFLSGPAAHYPVVLSYTVGGSATNPGDHDAVDGVITINSGTTGSLVFHTVDDGVTGEVNDQVVITLQDPTGTVVGSHRTHTVTITEENAAPLADLRVEQQGMTTLRISPDNGPVIVTAKVMTPIRRTPTTSTGVLLTITWSTRGRAATRDSALIRNRWLTGSMSLMSP